MTVTFGNTAATRDVASNFSDSDNDSLAYSAITSDSAVATASVSGSVVTVTPVAVGSATITVAAQDLGGLITTQTIVVMVVDNQAPIAVGTIAAVTIDLGGGVQTRDVASNFNDPDNDRLVYGVSSSDRAVVRAYLDDSEVEVYHLKDGSAIITVTARDPGGLSAIQTIAVTVNPARANDLIVSAISVSDSTLTAGDSFTLTATVRNQGPEKSPPTYLDYYRSTDSTLAYGDTKIGSRSSYRVVSLADSVSSEESISLTALSSPNTLSMPSMPYYYGACVRSVVGETNTDNNCSTGVAVTVKANPASAPDLTISALSVSDSTLRPGDSFNLDATVRNDGNADAGRVRMRTYISFDSVISSDDTLSYRYDYVSNRLSASETISWQGKFNAPYPAGTYYYIACVGV